MDRAGKIGQIDSTGAIAGFASITAAAIPSPVSAGTFTVSAR